MFHPSSLILLSPREAGCPHAKVFAVPIEALCQQESGAVQNRGKAKTAANCVLAFGQTAGTLDIRVGKELVRRRGRNERRQVYTQKPERQTPVVKSFKTVVHRFLKLGVMIGWPAECDASFCALVIAVTDDERQPARGQVLKTQPGRSSS